MAWHNVLESGAAVPLGAARVEQTKVWGKHCDVDLEIKYKVNLTKQIKIKMRVELSRDLFVKKKYESRSPQDIKM